MIVLGEFELLNIENASKFASGVRKMYYKTSYQERMDVNLEAFCTETQINKNLQHIPILAVSAISMRGEEYDKTTRNR